MTKPHDFLALRVVLATILASALWLAFWAAVLPNEDAACEAKHSTQLCTRR